MGLDINGTRFLLYAKNSGVDFSKSAMIGRQRLHLSPDELKKNLTEFGFAQKKEAIRAIFDAHDGYCEELLIFLGADTTDSFDNSSYEGATHVHDMNNNIPDKFKERYSMVLDGGSLEHIFNFPVAIKNCMEMVMVGGYYLAITPVNNLAGHGFYQFSPELYFSVFTKQNGYETPAVIAYETRKRKWYSVASPLSVRGRVPLVNKNPTYLLVIAKRIGKTDIFKSAPQQSDYSAKWAENETLLNGSNILLKPARHTFSNATKRLIKNLKRPILKLIGNEHYLGFDPVFYTEKNPTDTTKTSK